MAIETPAKNATKAKCGSAGAEKEVMAVRKRKPDEGKVPCKEKRAMSTKKSLSPTLTKTTTIIFSCCAEKCWIVTPSTSDRSRQQ